MPVQLLRMRAIEMQAALLQAHQQESSEQAEANGKAEPSADGYPTIYLCASIVALRACKRSRFTLIGVDLQFR